MIMKKAIGLIPMAFSFLNGFYCFPRTGVPSPMP